MSHPKDGLVVNLYIPHNRRMPFEAEEARGLIYPKHGSAQMMHLLFEV
jgi:hypothetical protein